MHFLLGLNAKLKTLIDRLTSTRAGYFDNLPIIKTCTDRLTSTRATYIDYINTINSRVTAAVATATALATVDSNVDTLTALTSQDLRYYYDSYISSEDTILSVSGGGGTLLAVGVKDQLISSFEDSFIKTTTDAGSERTLSGLHHFPIHDNADGEYTVHIDCNIKFDNSLVVKAGNSNTAIGAYVIYALNK